MSPTIEISEVGPTRLRVEIPTDVVTRIQHLAESITSAEEFAKAVKEERPFVREVKISTVEGETASPR